MAKFERLGLHGTLRMTNGTWWWLNEKPYARKQQRYKVEFARSKDLEKMMISWAAQQICLPPCSDPSIILQ
ncbi:hypothetical protein EJB05_56575, partial [Eragrostis curvula]